MTHSNPSAPSTIVVHGATGTQGQALVRRLQAAGHRVRPVARHVPPHPDLGDPASLAEVYDGADAVVVQLPLVFGSAAVEHAEHVLQALDKAGVRRAVFNSGTPLPPDRVGVPYVDARVALASSLSEVVPVSAVVSPAGPYTDNLGAAWSVPLLADGRLVYPLPADLPIPWVALDDLAAVVVELLAADDPVPTTVLAGPEALTGPEAAAQVSEALGREVVWETIGHEEYGAMLRPHLGAEAADGIAAAYAPPPPDAPPPPAPTRLGTTTVYEWAGANAPGWSR